MILKFVKFFPITLHRCEATWREMWSIGKKLFNRNWSSLDDNNTFLINSNASENVDFFIINEFGGKVNMNLSKDVYFETFDTEKLYLLLIFYLN